MEKYIAAEPILDISQLINLLKCFKPNTLLAKSFNDAHVYNGDWDNVSFDETIIEKPITVADQLEIFESITGKILREGKSNELAVTPQTQCNIASRNFSGRPFTAIDIVNNIIYSL